MEPNLYTVGRFGLVDALRLPNGYESNTSSRGLETETLVRGCLIVLVLILAVMFLRKVRL